jgi:hypothetical protein
MQRSRAEGVTYIPLRISILQLPTTRPIDRDGNFGALVEILLRQLHRCLCLHRADSNLQCYMSICSDLGDIGLVQSSNRDLFVMVSQTLLKWEV